ncbi:hypothetical protein [Leifsonia shinshuensis]|uniref:Uncharacterized protein n=1 Tax=Leifsonia shinshuensis TaxID=150026 RepID=A0A7G6Y6C8_9MICO|nr:hypothetical protein [Leifsonia shinshuensis]QNE34043.1 hypothetical protein F1C12_02055 [Leifsonia shinshuensis]
MTTIVAAHGTRSACFAPPRRARRMLGRMSSIRERISAWFKREREYVPPPGRQTEDTTRRLPDGGAIQRMPGDGVDPASVNARTGRNP